MNLERDLGIIIVLKYLKHSLEVVRLRDKGNLFTVLFHLKLHACNQSQLLRNARQNK